MAVTLLVLLLLAGTVSAQIVPEPIATAVGTITFDEQGVYNAYATAVPGINTLPDNIEAPQGVNIVPTVDLSQLFAFVKWLFSPATADELLWVDLAPIGVRLFRLFLVVLSLTTVWFIINLITLIIKALIWLYKLIMQIVQTVTGFFF